MHGCKISCKIFPGDLKVNNNDQNNPISAHNIECSETTNKDKCAENKIFFRCQFDLSRIFLL